MAATLILLFTTFTRAQDSQFFFDSNGNLFVQTGATITPPQIIGQPQNQIVALGGSASFFVVAADTRALTYEWRFNDVPLGGSATNDAVLLQNVSTNNEGEYRVVLTNPSGSVTSAPAMLWLDGDADGVADSWELTHFGNLTNSPTADFDGDGSSNLQEFLDGTNPANSNSVRFRLTVVRDGGSVTFNSQPSTLNQLSYTNGETVTLTATASSNDTFHAWLGDIVTRSNTVTLVMTNNKTVYARFTPISFLWTNVSGGVWEAATNWMPNLVPATNDHAAITLGITVTVNTSAGCGDFLLGHPSSVLAGSGTLTVYGNGLWSSGNMSGSGRTVIAPGATLNLANASGVVLTMRTLENGGNVLWTGAGGMNLTTGAITNRAGALFDAQGAGALFSGVGGDRFDNAGTFRKSASAGTTTIGGGVNFNNSGTVEVQSGTLLCSGGFTNNGAVNVSAGAISRLAGGGVASGVFNASAAGLVEWAGGTFMLGAAAQLNGAGAYKISGGTLTRNADLTVNNFDLAFGTLNVTGMVTIADTMNWTGGTMNGSGRTIIPAGATLNLANPGTVVLEARTLENGGTVLWTGAGSFVLNSGAVITNCAGALFEVKNASSLQANVGGGRFDNVGAFRKSAFTGTTTVGSGGVSFNNFGTVEIESGTLQYNAGFANNGAVVLSAGTTNRLTAGGSGGGTFNAAGAALVEWTGGTFTLNAGAQLNGAGVYRINVGTLTCNPDLTVSNLDLAFGTLNGPGKVTIASAMNWIGGTMSGTGRTIIAPGATLGAAPPGGGILSTRTLENGGSTLLSSGFLGVIDSAVVTNRGGAVFRVESETGGVLGGGGANGRFDNAGTFRKSAGTGTTTIASGLSFNNSGSVEIQTGTLLYSGSFNNNGSVGLSVGTTNRMAGGGSGSGTFNTPATALVAWTGGTFTLSAGGQLNGAGLYRINGGSVTANASFTMANLDLVSGSSTLGGTGVVTIANVMNWTAGTMGGTGRTIIGTGATMNFDVPNSATLDTRILENGGTILWNGAANIVLFNPMITNRAGALFHALNAATLFPFGSGRFDNAGTVRKSAGTGTTTFGSGMSFNNSGTVDIRSGILAANGGYTSTSNALLNCALGGTIAGTNYGQLQVAGTVTLNGALSVELINGFVPKTNDAFTVITAGTRNGTFANFFYPSNAATMQVSNTANSVIVRVTDVFSVPQPAPVPAGLISWWRAEGNALDSVSTNHGVLTNGATFATGQVGQTFALDGADDFVEVPDSASLRPASMTIETWVKFFATNGIRIVLVKPLGTGTFDSYGLWLRDGSVRAAVCDDSGFGPILIGPANTVTGQWYHLAYTFDDSSKQQVLYVNGISAASGTANKTMTYDTHPLLLGADVENGVLSFFHDGQIDEASLYNRALTSDEIATIYNAGAAGKQLPTTIAQPMLFPPVLSSSNVLLSWTAVSNKTYRLEFNPNLGPTNWDAVPGDVTTLSNTATKLDALTSSNRFYRVRVIQ